jgi:hypothetical protein
MFESHTARLLLACSTGAIVLTIEYNLPQCLLSISEQRFAGIHAGVRFITIYEQQQQQQQQQHVVVAVAAAADR